MHIIQMPEVGRGVLEGVVARWRMAEGEPVEAGRPLADIETAEADVELLAGAGGMLHKVLAGPGTAMAVGEPIALVGAPGEDAEAALAALQQPVAPETAPQPPNPNAQRTGPQPAENQPVTTQEKPQTAAEAEGGNVTPILMPQAGNTMEEGTIVAWKVAEGDQVHIGDVLFEVETDKAAIEVEADHAGRLARIVAPEGTIVEVKKPVAYLAENDAEVDAYIAAHGDGEAPAPTAPSEIQAAKSEPPPAPAPTPATPPSPPARSQLEIGDRKSEIGATSGRAKASPAARRIAAERGVNLAAIGPGSGPAGRILSTDVPSAGAGPAATPAVQRILPVTDPVGEPARTKLSPMRKAIAKNLSASKQSIPHFYMKQTIDAGPLFAAYRQTKARVPCSVNDFIVRACAACIHEFPAFRSRLDGQELVEYPMASIGIAVGRDDGLVVPVVVGADRMDFPQLAAETRRVVDSARNGKIDGLGQGVFTISNLGMFGIEEFSAIINPPEAAILAVSAIREAVIVKDGAMRPGRVMTLTLSCDHRIVDGLLAAKFMARLKELLESPEALV